VKVFGLLFWWRMRYFAIATFRLLGRRWQAALFLLFMASPAMMPLIAQLHMLGKPVMSIVEPGHFQRSACLWTLALMLAWGWSALQAGALSGGASWQHLLSLPLAPRLLQQVDLAVLLVTDLPLLLPFCAAEVALLHQGGIQAIPVAAAVAALAGQLSVLQLLAPQSLPRIGYCLVMDFAGLWALSVGASPWLLVAAVLIACLFGLILPVRINRGSGGRLLKPPSCLRLRGRSPAWNVAAIDLRYLFGTPHSVRHLGLLFCIFLPAVLHELLPGTGVTPAASILILCFMLAPLVLRVAGFTFDLQRLHKPMAQFYAASGFSESWLRRVDLFVLQAAFVVFCLPLIAVLYLHTHSWRELGVLPIGMPVLALCIRLNYRSANQALVPKFLLAALACGGLVWWLDAADVAVKTLE
jgi:hypothetical protein